MMKKLFYALTLTLVGAPAFAAVDPNETQISAVGQEIDKEQSAQCSCSKQSCKTCPVCKEGKPCKKTCKKGMKEQHKGAHKSKKCKKNTGKTKKQPVKKANKENKSQE
jgi:hypothetical protein